LGTGRKIIQNIFSLSFAELLSKGLIFLANAYLARIIMPEGFGIIGVANSIVVYLLLLTNLGFNTLGSREISGNRNLINKYVNNINSLRTLLSIIVFSVFVLIILQVDKSAEIKLVYIIAAASLLSNAILVDWVFLGTEKMNVLAVRQVLTSLLNLAGIYIFVHNRTDTVLAMGVFTATTFINSIWLLILYNKEFGRYRFELDFSFIKPMMKSSFHIAYYIFFVSVLNTININLLNILAPTESAGNYQAGIFNAASKIYVFSTIPSAIIQQAFFPLLSRSHKIEDRHNTLDKYSMLLFIVGPITTLILFTFSPFIINTVYGSGYAESSLVMQYLMLASFFVFVNTSFTVPLLAWKFEKYSTYAIIVGTIVNIAGNFIFIPIMGAAGSGMATLFGEFSISVTLILFIYKILNRFYMKNLLKMTIFSGISCLTGYLMWQSGIYAIISAICSILIFFIMNFVFKTITISEIKGYLKK
jgi:O-antigen/teichoic acid export membrane protein